MTKKLKVGIIGCGGIANGAHMPGYARWLTKLSYMPPVTLFQGGPRGAKEQYDMKYMFEDLNEMLELDELDIISVCTPNDVHNPAAIAALKAGKHVLC